jgi:hypothetical protein
VTWSGRLVSIAGLVGSMLGIILAFVTEQVAILGSARCEVYCGPGSQVLPFGWMVATAAFWLVGLGLSVRGLIDSRARSIAAWLGTGVSLVLPLAVVYLTLHPASGS